MKRFASALAALCLSVSGAAAEPQQMKLAVTTSFHNSGLSDILIPEIKQDLDLEVQLLVVGTGQALRLGRAGDVDAILVHSRAAEEAFVAEGYGTHRREIMYNDFVLIGPKSDPAGVIGSSDVAAALGEMPAKHRHEIRRRIVDPVPLRGMHRLLDLGERTHDRPAAVSGRLIEERS